MKKVTITIDEAQLRDIWQAVEFASRFASGQINCHSLPNVIQQSERMFKWDTKENKLIYDKRFVVDRALNQVKRIIFSEYSPNESSSIDNVSTEMQEFSESCYDFYRTIAEYFESENPRKEWNVYKKEASPRSKFSKPVIV